MPSSAVNFAFVPLRHQLMYCNAVLLGLARIAVSKIEAPILFVNLV